MATRYDIEQRRIKVEQLLSRGMNNTTIAKLLGVTRPTVIGDVKWVRAKNRKFVTESDQNQVVGDALSKYEQLQHMAMKEFHSSPEGTATRGGFITLMGKLVEASIKMRQGVGLLPKEGKLNAEDAFALTDGVDPADMSVEELRRAAEQFTIELAKEVSVSPEKLQQLMDEMEAEGGAPGILPPPKE